mmetsp:Transcript_1329/g.4088  ORF Transcript_1329/g.4088 Transcript_1329/m.4088 type:complete len:383 (-) Transcript_1329:360-1508(-)|eukprot:CAMPEP_0202052686 /NCGR_PEP_ID=MMETSP0963-20130614/5409_1 /ASSEMBLY_ACC=CAM_ASM_000494 /TAXON_ID=4773 /ORGANISM="Schizochytrium aggregatum, Strain ATCC28209" /LENGTH=382 /DNA_ID=CAMNT_0048617979 /DNA_START=24 /DNA_END=1172 /DNA_ORIENTATION=+
MLARLASRAATCRQGALARRWPAPRALFSDDAAAAARRAKDLERMREGARQAKRDAANMQKFERSKIDGNPKLIVGVFAFAIAGGALSVIAFFETSRCDAGDAGDADSVLHSREPITGTAFPLTLMGYSSSDSTHWLVAKTVRCMLGMCSIERARAYAYAVYFGDDAAELCGKCGSVTEAAEKLLPRRMCEIEAEDVSAQVESDAPDAFIPASKFQGPKRGYVFKRDDALGGLGYHKDRASLVKLASEARRGYPSIVLRLVMLRDVGGDHIAHGFDRTLLGRVREVQGSRAGTGKSALRELNQFVTRRGEWKKGTVLEFLRLPEGRLSVRVDGRDELMLHSEALSWAIFDAYLGKKGHMSTAARKELLERTQEIAALIAERK